MIGSLRGVVLERSASGEVLVEVNGIGYRVQVTPRELASVGGTGSEAFLYIHQVVREDAHLLYGFLTRDERACFEALIGAHGVGPALAQSILAVLTPEELGLIVQAGDLDALCAVPGIGKKTAARLVIELKGRLETGSEFEGVVDAAVGGQAGVAASALADVRQALGSLGYGPDEVRDALAGLSANGDAATLLREALQRLGSSR